MNFALGDWVECEAQDNGRPRWSGSIDYGGNGKWLRGKVVAVAGTHVMVRFASGPWHLPLQGDSDYTWLQWTRPGFLRRAG